MITTILPTYRRPKLLERSIRSVLRQTFPHLTLCICDNASGDSTAHVVKRFAADARVQYFCHDTNVGCARNYSFGLAKVATPFFSMLADDDLLLPEFYSKALREFERCPEAEFVVGHSLLSDMDGTLLQTNTIRYTAGLHTPPEGVLSMLAHRIPTWTGILFRTRILDRLTTCVSEEDGIDFGFLLQASLSPYSVIHDPCAVFSRHPESSTYRLHLTQIWPSHSHAGERLLLDPLVGPIRQEARTALQGYLQELLLSVYRGALTAGAYEEAVAAGEIIQSQLGGRVPWYLARLAAVLMNSRMLRPLAEGAILLKSKVGQKARRIGSRKREWLREISKLQDPTHC